MLILQRAQHQRCLRCAAAVPEAKLPCCPTAARFCPVGQAPLKNHGEQLGCQRADSETAQAVAAARLCAWLGERVDDGQGVSICQLGEWR